MLYLQIITVKDAKRRLSLSSEGSEEEETEYLKEVDDDRPVLDDHSQLLVDHHIKPVSSSAVLRKNTRLSTCNIFDFQYDIF